MFECLNRLPLILILKIVMAMNHFKSRIFLINSYILSFKIPDKLCDGVKVAVNRDDHIAYRKHVLSVPNRCSFLVVS